MVANAIGRYKATPSVEIYNLLVTNCMMLLIKDMIEKLGAEKLIKDIIEDEKKEEDILNHIVKSN